MNWRLNSSLMTSRKNAPFLGDFQEVEPCNQVAGFRVESPDIVAILDLTNLNLTRGFTES